MSNGPTFPVRAVLRVALLVLPLLAIWRGEPPLVRATRVEQERAVRGEAEDPAAPIERLALSIAHVLPAHGNVGYLNPHHSWTDAKATYQFYVTQYALVPRVLLNSTVPRYVIYFSHRGEPLAAQTIPSGMRVLLQPRADLAVLVHE